MFLVFCCFIYCNIVSLKNQNVSPKEGYCRTTRPLLFNIHAKQSSRKPSSVVYTTICYSFSLEVTLQLGRLKRLLISYVCYFHIVVAVSVHNFLSVLFLYLKGKQPYLKYQNGRNAETFLVFL